MPLILSVISFGWVPAPVARKLSHRCSDALPPQPDWRILWPSVAGEKGHDAMGCGADYPANARVWWVHCQCGSVSGPFRDDQGVSYGCGGCYRELGVCCRTSDNPSTIRGSDGFIFEDWPFYLHADAVFMQR
jgi:hypothetical protein